MRLLHQWHHDVGQSAARCKSRSRSNADRRCIGSQSLPLRHARACFARNQARGADAACTKHAMNTPAGVLPLSLKTTPRLDRWLRVNAAGTLTVYSGKVELGQGIET